jgi:hypothetical protein
MTVLNEEVVVFAEEKIEAIGEAVKAAIWEAIERGMLDDIDQWDDMEEFTKKNIAISIMRKER